MKKKLLIVSAAIALFSLYGCIEIYESSNPKGDETKADQSLAKKHEPSFAMIAIAEDDWDGPPEDYVEKEQCLTCSLDKSQTVTNEKSSTVYGNAWGSGFQLVANVSCRGSVSGSISNANFNQNTCKLEGDSKLNCSVNIACDVTFGGSAQCGAAFHSFNINGGAEIEVGGSLGNDININIDDPGSTISVDGKNCFEAGALGLSACASKMQGLLDRLFAQANEQALADLGQIIVTPIFGGGGGETCGPCAVPTYDRPNWDPSMRDESDPRGPDPFGQWVWDSTRCIWVEVNPIRVCPAPPPGATGSEPVLFDPKTCSYYIEVPDGENIPMPWPVSDEYARCKGAPPKICETAPVAD